VGRSFTHKCLCHQAV